MFEQFQSHDVKVDGEQTIHAVSAGSGPALLLLHGFPQTHAMWARTAPLLAERYTVVASDLRGYGASSKPPGAPDAANYSFRTMAADQVALMRALGHERFHLVGHDRGARTAHRLALDHPAAVRSLAVLDIVPTHSVFTTLNRDRGMSFWHWFFLAQPAPFPERLIAADPDRFYETCMAGWGRSKIEDFAADQMAEYRRAWRDPAMHHGSCSDYRAAATIDLAHDTADLQRKVQAPALALWGASGAVGNNFDPAALWSERCERLECATMPYGHFFIDRFPVETARTLGEFLAKVD